MHNTYSFFHLYLVNFNPTQLVFELIIELKLVPVLHIFALSNKTQNIFFKFHSKKTVDMF